MLFFVCSCNFDIQTFLMCANAGHYIKISWYYCYYMIILLYHGENKIQFLNENIIY